MIRPARIPHPTFGPATGTSAPRYAGQRYHYDLNVLATGVSRDHIGSFSKPKTQKRRVVKPSKCEACLALIKVGKIRCKACKDDFYNGTGYYSLKKRLERGEA